MARRVLGALAVWVAVGLFSAPAYGGGWRPPVNLSDTPTQAGKAQVAVDARGDAVAIWLAYSGYHTIIRTAFRPAASAHWQPPVDLTLDDQDAFAPQVALDAKGNAIAVWDRRWDGSHSIVQASFRSAASGTWEAPVELPSGLIDDRPQIAFDPQGDAMAVWSGIYGVQAAFRPAATGVWQPADDLETDGKCTTQDLGRFCGQDPQFAFDQQGNAIAVWSAFDGSGYRIEAARRPFDTGVWGPPTMLSEVGGTAITPDIAYSARGDAIAIWRRAPPGGGPPPGPALRSSGASAFLPSAYTPFAVQASLLPAAGGGWQRPFDVSDVRVDTCGAQIAFDPQGNATVVYTDREGTKAAAWTAASGTWQDPVELAPGGVCDVPDISFDSTGNALAIWPAYQGIQAALLPATTGVWQTPTYFPTGGHDARAPHIAFDAQGNGLAVWSQLITASDTNTSPVLVQAAEYDAAGPALASMSLPASGRAGSPVRFSVTPDDLWSPLGPTTWSFGDGAIAHGKNIKHTYRKRGAYHVILTSLDALGNASTASRTITIKTALPPLRIAAARLTARSFRVTLTTAARLTISIARTGPGSHAPLGAIALPHAAKGRNSIAFDGRLGGRALPAGRYIATVTARNANGSATASLAFTIEA
jgi:hypothetical protein